MKKIKKFIKRHFKKIATVLCVVISCFVFTIASSADTYLSMQYDFYADFEYLEFLILDRPNGESNEAGYRGNVSYIRNGYPNNMYTSLFHTDNNVKYYFEFTAGQQPFYDALSYTTGYMQIQFDLLLEEVPNFDFYVYGYNLIYNPYNNYEYATIKEKLNYDYVDIKFTSITSSVFGYSRACARYRITLTVPLRQYVTSVELNLRTKNSSCNNGWIRATLGNYTTRYYQSVADLPNDIEGIAQEELNDIQKENEITDQLLDGVGEGTNAYKEIIGGISNGKAYDLLEYMQYAGALAAPIMEIPRMEVILRLALITGVFTLVFSISSHVYGFFDSKAHPDKPKNTSTKSKKKG